MALILCIMSFYDLINKLMENREHFLLEYNFTQNSSSKAPPKTPTIKAPGSKQAMPKFNLDMGLKEKEKKKKDKKPSGFAKFINMCTGE